MTDQPIDKQDAKAARVPASTPSESSSEVLRARAELAATVDALAAKLSPQHLAAEASATVKQAATDAGAFLIGGGLPVSSEHRVRNTKLALGAVAGLLIIAAIAVSRRAK